MLVWCSDAASGQPDKAELGHSGEWRGDTMSEWCKLRPRDSGVHYCAHGEALQVALYGHGLFRYRPCSYGRETAAPTSASMGGALHPGAACAQTEGALRLLRRNHV